MISFCFLKDNSSWWDNKSASGWIPEEAIQVPRWEVMQLDQGEDRAGEVEEGGSRLHFEGDLGGHLLLDWIWNVTDRFGAVPTGFESLWFLRCS